MIRDAHYCYCDQLASGRCDFCTGIRDWAKYADNHCPNCGDVVASCCGFSCCACGHWLHSEPDPRHLQECDLPSRTDER